MSRNFQVKNYGTSLSLFLIEFDNLSVHGALNVLNFLRYYFSTFEDDSLLCLLDDDAYSKDEQKINVIPEDVNFKKSKR